MGELPARVRSSASIPIRVSQLTVSVDVLASPVSCTFFVSGQQSPAPT